MQTVVIDPLDTPNIDHLFNDSTITKTFFFKDGEYTVTKQINISGKNVRMIGLSGNASAVHLIQETVDQNLLNITGDNFTMSDMSLHSEEGDTVCLSQSGSSWSHITNCHFYGSDTNFTVYFAGPDVAAGQETIDAYTNNLLDTNNIFDNNVIYTKWSGDAVSFSLQRFGSLRNNIIRGGKLAVYMVKDSTISHNYAWDSSAHGIICSLPCNKVEISNNVIRKSSSASISLRAQLEHGDFNTDDHDLVIKNNTITDCKHIGIEVNSGHNIVIDGNVVIAAAQTSIYLLRCSGVSLKNNTCVGSDNIVVIDIESTLNSVTNNTLYSVFPKESHHAVLVEATSTGNEISSNTTRGRFVSVPIQEISVGDNVVTNNDHHLYVSQEKENKLLILEQCSLDTSPDP